MSSLNLVERFPALFWTPDEFDSPDTESVRPIRVPLLKRTTGGFTVQGTKTLTRPDKLDSKGMHIGVDLASGPSTSKILLAHPGPSFAEMTDPDEIKKTAKLLGMETVDPGDPEPTVDIQKVGSLIVKEVHIDEDGNVQGVLQDVPLHDTPEALKKWLDEHISDDAVYMMGTPIKGPTDPVVTVKTVGDFMDHYSKKIAEGLAVPEEYWNPEAGTNKGKCFEEVGVFVPTGACESCMKFGGAYSDPLSGHLVSVVCYSEFMNIYDASEKYTYDVAGKEAGCVYYEPVNGPKGK